MDTGKNSIKKVPLRKKSSFINYPFTLIIGFNCSIISTLPVKQSFIKLTSL